MINLPVDSVKAINIAVILLYAFSLWRGAKKGFLLQILSTFGTMLAFLAAWRYRGVASKFYRLWPDSLNPMKGNPYLGDAVYAYLNEIIWFAALFLIICLLFLILGKLVSGISSLPVIKEVSGLLGAVLGGLAATVWVLVICTVMNTPLFTNGAEIAKNSLIGTISDAAASTVSQFAGPIDTSEVFQKVYSGAKDLDDKDKEFLEDWLIDHGIEPVQAPAVTEGTGAE